MFSSPMCRLRAVALALCMAAGSSLAGPPPWPDATYSYYAENVPLESLLSEFASSFSLRLSLQPGVGGVVNGRFTAKNPTEFISRLGGVYGFTWYTYGATLYVSKTGESVMRSLPLPDGSPHLRAALTELGVIEPRFGWAELPEQRVVLVSGPASYVQLVESTLMKLPSFTSQQEVKVFRLRYASAEDRSFSYRDQTIVQPGLASVLRELIAGRTAIKPGNPMGQSAASSGSVPPAPSLLGNASDPAAAGQAASPSASASAPSAASPGPSASSPSGALTSAGSRYRAPSIHSDPRLNAVIVQDEPERMPVYEQLIAQLDVPSPLIEIEAMIVDVNSERARELGINWSVRSSSASVDFGVPGSLTGAGTLSFVSQSGGGASTLIANGGTQLLAQLRLLENHGDARIQSRPSVLTIDNIAALLDLSETFYVRVQGERVANVSPITAGTTLKVTPRLITGPQPSIQLTIDIEDGQIQDRQIDALPTVRRSTVSTQAIVGLDQTLLIAGYALDQDVETHQKVPGLGDLPGIGVLFSNKVRTLQKRERLFMIRPKLVGLPSAAAASPSSPRVRILRRP